MEQRKIKHHFCLAFDLSSCCLLVVFLVTVLEEESSEMATAGSGAGMISSR